MPAALAACALAVLFTASSAAREPLYGQHFPAAGSVDLAFTPGDDIDLMLSEAIDSAQTEVLVHAYSFTQRRIARALIRARARGVDVRVLADREQARALPQNVLGELSSSGVSVWLDANFASAHNKVIIIDAESPHATTVTGSYNFTLAAQRSNAENVLVLRDNPRVAQAYRRNWQRLKSRAVPWQGQP